MTRIFYGHSSLSTSALATSEQSIAFPMRFLSFIANDGNADVWVNFDSNVSSAGAVPIKAGEVLQDMHRSAQTLYYRASTGTQAIRVFALK